MQLTNEQKEILSGKRCPYCKKPTEYINASIVFGKSLHMIYFCGPCWSWCGVHEGTDIALGRLANAELRYMKQEAHKWFDMIWAGKYMTRKKAYRWLSFELNLPEEYTHIGMFSPETCKKVIELSKQFLINIHDKKRRNARST